MNLMLMALPLGGPTGAFYDSWIDYLQPKPHLLLNIIQWMCQGITQFLYAMGSGALEAWQKAWQFADFAQIFTNAHHAGATGFNLGHWVVIFLILGLVIFGIVMAVQIFEFTVTGGRRGHDWPKGVMIIFLIFGFTPVLMSSGLKIAKAVNMEIVQPQKQDPMITILQNNSIDLSEVAKDNFNVKQSNIYNYSPVTKMVDMNKTQNSIVGSPIFTSTMDDKANLKGLSDAQKKVFENKAGIESNNSIAPLDKGDWLTGSAFRETYPRIKVNWIGVMAAYIVYTLTIFLAIIELLLRFYRLAYYSLSLLYFAFRDAGGKKAVQIFQLMAGSIEGAAMMPVGVMIFFAFTQYGVNIIAQMHLSWWPYTVLTIAMLLAALKGLLSGFSLIDQFTGVPTGQSNAAQTAMAGMMGARMAGSAIKSAGSAAVGAASIGSNAAKRLKQIADAKKDADKGDDKMHKKLKQDNDDNPEPPAEQPDEGKDTNPDQNDDPTVPRSNSEFDNDDESPKNDSKSELDDPEGIDQKYGDNPENSEDLNSPDEVNQDDDYTDPDYSDSPDGSEPEENNSLDNPLSDDESQNDSDPENDPQSTLKVPLPDYDENGNPNDLSNNEKPKEDQQTNKPIPSGNNEPETNWNNNKSNDPNQLEDTPASKNSENHQLDDQSIPKNVENQHLETPNNSGEGNKPENDVDPLKGYDEMGMHFEPLDLSYRPFDKPNPTDEPNDPEKED